MFARFLVLPWVVRLILWWAHRHPDSSIHGPDGSLYMERFWVFNPYSRDGKKDHVPRWPWVPFSIRVHKIHRPDSDRALHDHPWAFRTFILRGGYEECRQDGLGEFHRITSIMLDGPAVTLVVMGRQQNEWGFLVDGKKVPWGEHLKAGTLRPQGAAPALDSGLQAILDCMTGRWGPWLHTYPNMPKKRGLYDGCLQLERLGLVRRVIDEPGHVCWVRTDYVDPGV